jgi:hypothetical protein
MTTWTGSYNSSLPLSYQKCPDHAVCGRVLRESRGASRFGASAGTAVTVLYPAARARNALAKAGSSLTVTIMASTIARVAAVIWSPNLGVFAVSGAGVLCAFPGWWTRYLDSVSPARLTQIPLSLLF